MLKNIVSKLLLVAALLVPGLLHALTPPDPGDLQKYRRDGSLPQRQAQATAFGNHKFAPDLIYKLRQKVAAA